jgi:3D (Asp-Asp-Asp) domain-containing protein
MQKICRLMSRAYKGLNGVVRGRALWSCLLMSALSGVVWFAAVRVQTVIIKDENREYIIHTFQKDPKRILGQKQIAAMAFDIVETADLSGKLGLIEIKRAFPVVLKADGTTKTIMTHDAKVEDFLAEQGIELGPYDTINISPKLYLSPNEQIEIKRAQMHSFTEITQIPYDTVYKQNSLLRAGRTRVLKPGSPGIRERTFSQLVVDGREQEPILINDVIIKKPEQEMVLKGGGVAVSSLDFGIKLDKNGVPEQYTKLLTNQICTGYSAGKGAYGASLMNLYAGYVAVRADEIPYGTRMYITSPDNKFVYGFAIAADTGIALMDNIIDFDLFYETYEESCLNGRKYLNVYILD